MSQKKVLEDALKTIEKQFGKWSIMLMWDNKNLWSINTYHSWSYILDNVLGGGYPEGRIIEMYGPEWSWKTTIALHAIASIQKAWGTAAFIDAEHALDPTYAEALGVDTDKLLLSQPDYGEQALQIAQELAKTWAVKVIVIDSVAAMVPRAEVEGDMWASHMGLQARMMSQWLRKLTSILAKTWTVCIFINQIRMKIGVMFGNPETTTWWNALKFYASQRLEIRRGEKMTKDKVDYGYVAKVKIVKNKIAPPFKVALVPVLFGNGFDANADLVEAAIQLELITRAWAFYTYGEKKVQWKDNLIQRLQENPTIKEELSHTVDTNIKEIRIGKRPIPETEKDYKTPWVMQEVVEELEKASSKKTSSKKDT